MEGAVELAAGELEAVVQGGALLTVAVLRHRGDDLLVDPGALPTAYLVHGVRAGITLLHPWANRLGADRFTTAGAEVLLDDEHVGRDPAGLALHGLAVPGTWEPAGDDDATATASAAFAAVPAFPWAHAVDVRFALMPPARLTVTTSVRATGDAAVPVAFGWHPYLALPGAPRADWRLVVPGGRHLGLDDRGLPDGTSDAFPPQDEPLRDRVFDDGYTGLADGAALALTGGGRRVTLTLQAGYPAAQIFAPGDRDVVSLEPMTAPTDALRTGHGLPFTPSAGGGFAARFSIDVAG